MQAAGSASKTSKDAFRYAMLLPKEPHLKHTAHGVTGYWKDAFEVRRSSLSRGLAGFPRRQSVVVPSPLRSFLFASSYTQPREPRRSGSEYATSEITPLSQGRVASTAAKLAPPSPDRAVGAIEPTSPPSNGSENPCAWMQSGNVAGFSTLKRIVA
ncbi:uncharacterized protein CC84DRAFT_1179325 [Paraphaeosphaeria sporulosa]|uniref:Uncharacterized protein n=1 Tax=Paraphaeosphaeria sporulosa TaxID=1460663 RepID=A0A177C4R6_9PLEO|nr:uncharacterized protein CC84DRAFT_1179325 [Paraphaeosphaeria sporulosa]OAG02416.1 hypothetical protein CC84DRAFT_1179325 [Paraphaeosphaeria sporulosa]